MRKLLWISSILLAALFATSCSSDDDSGGNNNDVDVIVGIWKISDVKLGGFSVYDVVAETEAACFLETSYQFNNDHTLVIRSFMQNPESENTDCISIPDQTGEWSKSGNTYTVTIAGESGSETLNFSDNNHFSMTYEMEGITYSVVFSRQ